MQYFHYIADKKCNELCEYKFSQSIYNIMQKNLPSPEFLPYPHHCPSCHHCLGHWCKGHRSHQNLGAAVLLVKEKSRIKVNQFQWWDQLKPTSLSVLKVVFVLLNATGVGWIVWGQVWTDVWHAHDFTGLIGRTRDFCTSANILLSRQPILMHQTIKVVDVNYIYHCTRLVKACKFGY